MLAESQAHSQEGEEEEVEEGELIDTEERVHEVMEQVISGQADVDIEEWQVDIDETASVVAMTETTCGCRKGIGSRPCSSQFSTDHLMSV